MTIYGACLGTRYTLHHCYLMESREPGRHFDDQGRVDDRDRGDDQHSQRWRCLLLLSGDALPDDALFGAAAFELTGLSAWWPFSGLDGRSVISSDNESGPEPTIVECGAGLVIKIGTSISTTSEFRDHGMAERVVIYVEHESGLTFSALLDQIVAPLRGLLAIVLHCRVEYFNFRLRPHKDVRPNRQHGFTLDVDPDVIDATTEAEAYGQLPTFTAKDVPLASLIPKWLQLAADNPVPLAVAECHDQAGSLQIQVVEAVNAAETLHRRLHNQPTDFPFATKVSKALKQVDELTSRERDKVKSAVKLTELSLKDRLLQLALGLGADFCRWFFDDQVDDWASVAAATRNALSHGYPTKHGVQNDYSALVGVFRITQAVIQLVPIQLV
jgi:ApeA N-terminal domain 1